MSLVYDLFSHTSQSKIQKQLSSHLDTLQKCVTYQFSNKLSSAKGLFLDSNIIGVFCTGKSQDGIPACLMS